MPIEFACPSCSQTLRTPDESQGKKARCPQCQAVVDVPSEAPSALDQALALAPTQAQTPFAAPEVNNPYAAPASKDLKPQENHGEMQLSKVVLEECLTRAWDLFKAHLGPVLAIGFIYIVCTMSINMVTGVVRIAGQASGEPALLVIGAVVQQVVSFLANTFFNLGMVAFGIEFCRTGQPKINTLFSVGRYYLKGLLLNLMIGVIVLAVLAVLAAPIAVAWFTTQSEVAVLIAVGILFIPMIALMTYITLRLYLANCFLIDRDMGVFDSLNASSQFMVGNKVTAFLASLVVGVISMIVILFTCGLATIAVTPYTMALMLGTFYLMSTGQPVHDPNRTTMAPAPSVQSPLGA